jgi:hypothetical protein
MVVGYGISLNYSPCIDIKLINRDVVSLNVNCFSHRKVVASV